MKFICDGLRLYTCSVGSAKQRHHWRQGKEVRGTLWGQEGRTMVHMDIIGKGGGVIVV